MAILGVLLAWGSSYSISRIAMGFMSPFMLSMFRFLIGGLVLLLISRGLVVNLRAFINALLNSASFVILLNLAIMYTSNPALASVLVYTQPVFVLIISAVMGYERISTLQAVGVALAFLGIVVSVGSVSFDIGSVLAVIGGFVWALGTIYYRRELIHEDLIRLNASMGLISALIALPTLIINPRIDLTPQAILWGVLVALVAQVTGFLLWFIGIRELGAVTASSMSLLVPVFAYAFAYALLGRAPTVIEALGSAVTLIGVFLAQGGAALKLRK